MSVKFLTSQLAIAFAGLMMCTIEVVALEAPKGDVVLTISGEITETNGGGVARFDIAMLEALPKSSIETASPWLGKSKFEGVRLADLLKAVGAKGTTIDAVAINDYAVKIPFEDVEKNGALLAYKVNGEYLPVRKKGPLWVMFDFDGNSSLRNEIFYTRSIWQLKSMKIE